MARLPHRPGFRTASVPVAGPGEEELSADDLTALSELRPEALERFYDIYFPRVYGYVARLVKDEHAAEDLTQDIFMNLHRALSKYDPRRPLRPWVFTIAGNKVRDYWSSRAFQDRARGTSDEEETELLTAPLEPRAPERGPRETLAGAELSEAVALAIERLPAQLRETLVLRYYEELSFEEIARIVERNEVAVRKRYSRALALLREELAVLYGLGLAERGRG
jgi:RNA polymerase sigma factor (sigma-70 family)